MKQTPQILALGMAAALFTAPCARAEDYQFIISGYPAANARSALASSSAAVVTGTLATPSSALGLEARYRTWLEALLGVKFNSSKPKGLFIIFH
jgi:hypothetical protein